MIYLNKIEKEINFFFKIQTQLLQLITEPFYHYQNITNMVSLFIYIK
jgi:hypothetical protein